MQYRENSQTDWQIYLDTVYFRIAQSYKGEVVKNMTAKKNLMKVLFICQFFPPETGAGPTRISEFAYNLVKAGHKVKVATSFPNYPHGIIFEGYRGNFFQREVLKGVIVERCLNYTSPKMNFIRRMMGEISFEIISTIRAMMSERYDIVFVSSPPFFSGIVGYLISKIKNSCFIFDIRDLFPDSAIAYGVGWSRP